MKSCYVAVSHKEFGNVAGSFKIQIRQESKRPVATPGTENGVDFGITYKAIKFFSPLLIRPTQISSIGENLPAPFNLETQRRQISDARLKCDQIAWRARGRSNGQGRMGRVKCWRQQRSFVDKKSLPRTLSRARSGISLRVF